eukprot:31393-Pelagococcus_subviridis.AAC.5
MRCQHFLRNRGYRRRQTRTGAHPTCTNMFIGLLTKKGRMCTNTETHFPTWTFRERRLPTRRAAYITKVETKVTTLFHAIRT